MSLGNLVAINRLQKHVATRESSAKLLAAAERNLADAHVVSIAAENRFDAAYKTILQCSMAALWAKGYRALTSVPGHHMTAIQALSHTLGLESDSLIILDALRKQRNLADDEGDAFADAALEECLLQAEKLLTVAKLKIS